MQANRYIIPDWPAPKNVRAASTTRQGGYSQAPYDSFNLGFRVADHPCAIAANHQCLKSDLKLPCEPMWLKQVHGTRVVKADKTALAIDADASYTQSAGLVCAVQTADCLPVLICNQQGTQVAAAHAGWRGLLNGVLEKTVETFEDPADDLMAWLGPAIGPQVFELNGEIREQFIAADPKAKQAFSLIADHRWLADIYQLARQRLANKGVLRVYGGQFCTYRDSARFYSHRRDQGNTGRMASLIWLVDQKDCE